MDELERIKRLTAVTALNDMLKKGWFDICVVRSVAEMLDVNPRGDAYNVLHTLHCINYDKMPAELKAAIPSLIQQCLGVEPAYQFKPSDLGFLGNVKQRFLQIVGNQFKDDQT